MTATIENGHRRWTPRKDAIDAITEHNALYDAYEAERQRAEKAEQRVKELQSRTVPPGVPSVEELARKAFLAIRPNDTEWDYQPTHETDRWIEIVAFVRDAILAARVKELEAEGEELGARRHFREELIALTGRKNINDAMETVMAWKEARTVPRGMPSVEELRGVYDRAYASRTGTMAEFHVDGITAVRDAILAALPVLTREEVEKQHRKLKGFSLSDAAPDTFTGWLASRLPARLERVAVTGSEIADAIRGKQVIPATKAVMTLLHEKQLVREPEPECFDVTEEDIAEVLDDQLSMVIDMDLCKAGAAAVMSLLREKQVVQEPYPTQKCESCGAPRHARKPCQYCNPVEDEPIATAETLEQLNAIGLKAYRDEHYKQCGGDKGDSGVSHAEVVRASRLAQTVAILRAARPEVDASWQDIYEQWDSDATDGMEDKAWLRSRIRYRVEPLPAAEPDDLRQRQIECYERVYESALARMGEIDAQELAIHTAAILPARFAELTAALDEKGGD